MSRNIQEDQPDMWMYHMRNGEFEKAWQISDAALASRAGKPQWHLPRHFQHIWDGSSLTGKRVLVRCYHGLGDTIQFIRFAPLVKAKAAAVILWSQPELIPLLRSVQGIDTFLPLHNGTPGIEFDVDVEIMELPHIFRVTPATLPAYIPYVYTDVAPLSKDAEFLSVGLVWKAGDWDTSRSIPFSCFTPLSAIKDIRFYILQGNAAAAGWNGEFGVYTGEHPLEKYASIIRGLDLLISVDSMPAHLAGALGVPVWTLLSANADWRWMNQREDSPWYPTMRLFRQAHAGDWQPVIERVTAELKAMVREREIAR